MVGKTTRPVLAALVAALALSTAACASSVSAARRPSSSWDVPSTFPTSTSPMSTGKPTTAPVKATTQGGLTPSASSSGLQLPRGGTEVFPRYRLVGYSGGSSKAFGRLGIGKLDKRVDEIERLGKQYTTGGREPLPVLELIAVVVQSSPGADGKYRVRIDDAQIGRYLAAARRHRALLLLNIQPGRADFLPEVQALAPWLKNPDVGIALDPEWAVGKHQKPGQVFGHTTAGELNSVARWLGGFTTANRLPEKVLVVHQLATRIISNVQGVKPVKGVAVVLSVDGIGSRRAKTETWQKLVKPMPSTMHAGFKLFFEEDREHGKLMTPAQVLRLKPMPEYVLYE